MVLNKKQLDVFNAHALEKYVSELMDYAKRNFPDYTTDQSDDALRNLVHQAIAKGKLYGFVSQRNVFLLLNVMLSHGANFDFGEKGKWARKVLTDNTIYSPDYRIKELVKVSNYVLININQKQY